MKKELITTSFLGLTASPAFAGAIDTSMTYSSGILVALFLGFCAMIVVIQLVPTIIMCYGFAKALFTGKSTTSTKVN